MRGLTLLITGGTGAFGYAFVRHVLAEGCQRVIVYSRSEERQREMRVAIPDDRLDLFLGDVRDRRALRRAMQVWRLDGVIHAAALKQVPACEAYPLEAVKTNVLGSANVIDAALDVGVSKVLAISSDKAVQPLNLYGATKSCMERLVVAANVYRGTHGTRFSCVRYGNVIGSTGSVLPVWRGQAECGEALTVTDPAMTRFWWTVQEAAAFTAQAFERMVGGEVFVPKLRACRIGALAGALSDRQVITGLRPNEKKHEVLIASEESARETDWAYVIEAGGPIFGRNYASDTAPEMTPAEVLGAERAGDVEAMS
jgi:UDP-N-acetylglucosamine 4,6-dehydratase